MAEIYYLYDTLHGNTILDTGESSFAPLPSDTGEIYIDFNIPKLQPLYLYRESGGDIVPNTEVNIDEYLKDTVPVSMDDYVDYNKFIEFTGDTENNLNKKIDKVTGATTNNLAVFSVDGSVTDSGVSMDSITGSTDFYLYADKSVQENTTSTTPTPYLTTGGTLSSGVYSVDFSTIMGNISPNKYTGIRFFIDGVQVGVDNYFKANAGDLAISATLTKDIYLNAGAHTFEIDFYNNGGTAYVQYGSIRVKFIM